MKCIINKINEGIHLLIFEIGAISENKKKNKAHFFQIWKKRTSFQGKVCKLIANNQKVTAAR